MESTSPRAIINCRACKAVTGKIELDGDAARKAYVLGFVDTHCPTCGIFVRAEAVRGTYLATKKCGGACLHAKRGDCECSCAGKNHGTGG